MKTNYETIAFSDEAKKLQEKFGSRSAYARLEKNVFYEGLTDHEIGFIMERDSFYMASMGDNGYPYIQHRGGPEGFIKVIDNRTIAFSDFRGNKQYISVGNIATNNKVALILVDYPRRTRLKLYAAAEVIELGKNAELEKLLHLESYDAKEERIIKLNIEAFSWNCPQHITPRYTLLQIEEAFSSQRDYIEILKKEMEELKNKLKKGQ